MVALDFDIAILHRAATAARGAQLLAQCRQRVSCQRKGRGGKTVTLVRGVPLAADALAVLGKQLRAACGSGGTVKDGDIEIQGDHVDTVLPKLAALGYTAKRSGG